MSGKIELKVRLGKSKDPRYDLYPEAYLEIKGENGLSVNISPSYNDICNMLIDFRKHELKVDKTRMRQPYASKLINTFEILLDTLKKSTLNETDLIDPIYMQPTFLEKEK